MNPIPTKAKLLRREPGKVVLAIAGTELSAVDRLGQGPSKQPVPQPGGEFAPSFSYSLGGDLQPKVLADDTRENPRLEPTGATTYRAIGRILSIDAVVDRRVQVAQVDCGGCRLPAPMEITDPILVGRLVAFDVEQLEVWLA